MARTKKTTTTEQPELQSQSEQEQAAPLTGSGEIEAPEEFAALESEIIDPGQDTSGVEDDYSAPGDFLGADACSGLCSMVFDVLAARRGEHWRLAPPEAEQLGGALDQVLAKYLPDNMEKWGPEITLLTVSAMIVLPRMRGTDAEA